MIINIAGYDQEVYTEETIKQARAEALRDTADRVKRSYLRHKGVDGIIAAILSDTEPKP